MDFSTIHDFTALVEAAKSLASLNVKGHGKVPYQKPQLNSMESMAHGVYPSLVHISAMLGANSM